MRKIVNPFKVLNNRKEYHCFGCSPFNETGLKLDFFEDAEELLAYWQPSKNFEGWFGVVHGGILASLADELGGWIVLTKLKTAGVTAELKMNYLKPVYVSKGKLTVRGKVNSVKKRIATIDCSIADGEGEICTTSEIKYFCFPENVAKAKYFYPGYEAFYTQ